VIATGDGQLSTAIRREIAAGRATRTPLEIERRLKQCRRCDQFRGGDCAEMALGGAWTLVDLLCREDLYCRRWSAAEEAGPRRRLVATEQQLDAMHGRGVKRDRTQRKMERKNR